MHAWQLHFGLSTFEVSVAFMPPIAVINYPKNLEYVLARPDIFVKGALFRSKCQDFFGDAILNADGHSWRVQRKAGVRFLTRARVRHLVRGVLPRLYHQCIEKRLDWAAVESGIDKSAAATVDMGDVFRGLTTGVMAEMAFDTDLDSDSEYCRAFEQAQKIMAGRFQNPAWRFTDLVRLTSIRRTKHTLERDGSNMLQRALMGNHQDTSGSYALEQTAADGKNLAMYLHQALGCDDVKPAQAMLVFLSAGKDTLAEAFTWTLYELTRHPTEMSKLRSLIDADSFGVNVANGKKLGDQYALAIFKESLRLHPPVPLNMKQCSEATMLADGTELPKGGLVAWSPWVLGRSRAVWGEEAHMWKPSRWLSGSESTVVREGAIQGSDSSAGMVREPSASAYPVFQGGPRACIGQYMAEAEGTWILKQLVSDWNIDLADSTATVKCWREFDSTDEGRPEMSCPKAVANRH